MITWTTIVIICGFFATLGALTDKLLLHRNKVLLHQRFTAWWIQLFESKFKTLPERLANTILSFRWLLWARSLPWWQSALLFLVINWILTTIAYYLAKSLSGYQFTRTFFYLPWFNVYIVNFLFDLFSVLLTLKVLKIVQSGRLTKSLVYILLNILIAYLFASICWLSMMYSGNVLRSLLDKNPFESKIKTAYSYSNLKYNTLTDSTQTILSNDGYSDKANVFVGTELYVKEHPLSVSLVSYYQNWQTVLWGPQFSESIKEKFKPFLIVTENEQMKYYPFSLKMVKGQARITGIGTDWVSALVPSTAFIPTLIFLAALMFLSLAKIVVHTSLHLLELITEQDPNDYSNKFQPFTLLGGLFGVIAALGKGIVELSKLFIAP